jgi:hypothetical protein
MISMCLLEMDDSAGGKVDPEKYRSLIIDISSLTLLELDLSCIGSSSSPDDPESMDSNGFLKLSTVSQNWTSKDRCRRSINSMKYERELGFLSMSRNVK